MGTSYNVGIDWITNSDIDLYTDKYTGITYLEMVPVALSVYL